MRAMGVSRVVQLPTSGVLPDPSQTGRPIILVADDDEDILKFIEVNLRAQGHSVVTATDGETALALALEHRPALVLLDIIIPGLDGYEICRKLRSDWRFGDPSVILLTGRSLPADRNLGLAAGADDFIVKPFDPVELVARVNLVLRRLEQVRSASPLTGLPGNLQIQRELQLRVSAGEEVALLYVDLDQFKAYNDHYGFLRGDEAIETLAEVLWQASEGRPDVFLGHVGGDDFIVLTNPDVVEGFVEDVIAGFEARVDRLYDPADVERGYIEINDRQGRKQKYSLLTLSIGVATNLGRDVHDHRVLVDAATEMKEFAKRKTGNAVAVDRRAGGDVAARLVGLTPVIRRRRPSTRRPRLVRGYLGGVGAVLIVMSLLLGPAAAAFAENAVPGEALYELKLGMERVRLLANSNPTREVQLHLEFATKRTWELPRLLVQTTDEGLVQRVTDNLRGHTASSVVGLRRADGPMGDEALRTQVETVLSHQVDTLSDLFERACGGTVQEGPGGLLQGNPGAACEDLRQAFTDSVRALDVVRPVTPVRHDAKGSAPRGERKGRGRGRSGQKADRAQSGGKTGPRAARGGPAGSAREELAALDRVNEAARNGKIVESLLENIAESFPKLP